jgi:hypothetical protein
MKGTTRFIGLFVMLFAIVRDGFGIRMEQTDIQFRCCRNRTDGSDVSSTKLFTPYSPLGSDP